MKPHKFVSDTENGIIINDFHQNLLSTFYRNQGSIFESPLEDFSKPTLSDLKEREKFLVASRISIILNFTLPCFRSCIELLALIFESHDTSTEGPVCSSHKEEEEAPTATSVKTVSCARLNKHKSKLNQNAIVSH